LAYFVFIISEKYSTDVSQARADKLTEDLSEAEKMDVTEISQGMISDIDFLCLLQHEIQKIEAALLAE
jgi:hypothetical protein